jgi:hypothetical protein
MKPRSSTMAIKISRSTSNSQLCPDCHHATWLAGATGTAASTAGGESFVLVESAGLAVARLVGVADAPDPLTLPPAELETTVTPCPDAGLNAAGAGGGFMKGTMSPGNKTPPPLGWLGGGGRRAGALTGLAAYTGTVLPGFDPPEPGDAGFDNGFGTEGWMRSWAARPSWPTACPAC